MTRQLDIERILDGFLADGTEELADHVLETALTDISITPQRGSWWPARRFAQMNNVARLAIAAAAVVVVAIAGYNLLPGGSGPGGPAPTPTPTAGPTAAPSPSPSPATTFPALFSTHPGGGEELAPGDWIITAVEPLRVTITVPERWYKGLHEWAVFPEENSPSVAFMDVGNVFLEPCDPAQGFIEPALGPTIDDLVAALAAVPGMEVTEPTDVTIDGYSGKHLVLSTPAESVGCASGEPAVFEGYPAPGVGDQLELWILDVEGARLVIGILGNQSAEARLPEAQGIVDSIRIEP